MHEIINRVVREQTNEIQEMIEEVVQEIANAASFSIKLNLYQIKFLHFSF